MRSWRDRPDLDPVVSNRLPPPAPVLAAIVDSVLRLQRAAGLSIDEVGREIGRDAAGTSLALPVPVFGHQAMAAGVTWLARLFNLCAAGMDTRDHCAEFPRRVDAIAAGAPATAANVPRFVAAARRLGIPTRDITDRIIQYGNGSRARWLESSFTDHTTHLGATLARSKSACALVLRRGGLPTPRHLAAADETSAVEAAERLGYPVVVKPENLDGGEAVSPGLMTSHEVRKAFAVAYAASPKVLVEKHFHGRDYRLVVFNSELIWTIERIPGGVTGDGKATVAELVAVYNLDPRRQGPPPPLPPLALDDEAGEMLGRAGLSPASIPADGAFVRRRRAADVVTGGTPVAVNEQVHPDNRTLAIRAAGLLGLDLAGIDLLIPDISRSWLETGAVICEVNARPNLGQTTSGHLYGEILSRLVEGDGRIPVAVVAGLAAADRVAGEICAGLAAAGMSVGFANSTGVSIAGRRVSPETLPLRATSVLALDRKVDVAVIQLDDTGILENGLAFDRFDALVLVGDDAAAPAGSPASDTLLASLLPALLPMCEGVVLQVAGRLPNCRPRKMPPPGSKPPRRRRTWPRLRFVA
jgi:cyanophycin synthetase